MNELGSIVPDGERETSSYAFKFIYLLLGAFILVPLFILFIYPLFPNNQSQKEYKSVGEVINRSAALVNQQRWADAEKLLENANITYPGNQDILNNLCVVYTLDKKYDQAIVAGNKAVELNPQYQLARNNLKWAQDEKQKSMAH